MHGFFLIQQRLFTRKFQHYRGWQQEGFAYCTKQSEEIPKEEQIKVSDGQILKGVVREVFSTVKDSAMDGVSQARNKIVSGARDFKDEAVQNKKDVSSLKTCLNVIQHAWKKTFPSQDEQARERMEQVKQRFAEQKKVEEQLKQYTEEELEDIQKNIPEWKKTAIQQMNEGQTETPRLRQKIKSKIVNSVSQTEFAQKISITEEYKEYQTFKSEMKQFREDVKERVQNHPSNMVQGSIYVYLNQKAITTETDIAKAIKQMRMIDPLFDLFQLEQDAKVIFEQIYLQYLCGELSKLEKVCGEMALGYFKVLLKKREAEKSVPKYKYLWNIEPAFFSKAFVPDTSKLPVFVFNIKAQEIYCYISKTDPQKIIDGDDERIMSMDYMFALTPHLEPSLDVVGHSWEMIEIQPREIVKMLV